jgi:hypothetical protein
MEPRIVSPLPGAPIERSQLLRLPTLDFGERSNYPQLPWKLSELVGSTWRNLHAGTLEQVDRIDDTGHRPLPCFHPRFPGSRQSPGFWWGDGCFMIEHWIRVDHWPAEAQLDCFGLELAFHRWMMAWCEQAIAFYQGRDTGMYEEYLAEHRRELPGVLARLRQFAETHRLAIPLDLLNTGLASARQPAQLLLW